MYTNYSVKQAANEISVSKQAIHFAIRKKRLPAEKINGQWTIARDDLVIYLRNRYSRSNLKHNGSLVYDPSKGLLSPSQIATVLNLQPHQIYYHIYRKNLPARQSGAAWIISLEDAKKHFKRG